MIDIKAYRRELEARVATAEKNRGDVAELLDTAQPVAARRAAAARPGAVRRKKDIPAITNLVRNADEDAAVRAGAIRTLAADLRERAPVGEPPSAATDGTLGDGPIQAALDLLTDPGQPTEVRRAALLLLVEARFTSRVLAAHRAELLQALRAVIDDGDDEIRVSALEVLAQERDGVALRLLLDGLEGRRAALVPAPKAIQLLSYDVHGRHFPVLKAIIASDADHATKREAVRALAADPTAIDVLAGVLGDPSQSDDVRVASGVSLQSLDRGRFQGEARRIALDASEPAAVRAACVSALDHFGNPAVVQSDQGLAEGVRALANDDSALGRAAARFQAKRPTR